MDLDLDDDDGGGDGAAWMATFADLSTLLLTFFVLLLSFANLDIVQFRMALGSVKEALGVQHEHPGDIMGMTTSPIELSKRESTPVMELVDELQLLKRVKAKLDEAGVTEVVETELGERGVVVRVMGRVLFDAGKARLKKEGSKTLDQIVELAHAIPFPIVIEGHTDDKPIRTREFPSNWELSAARATTALRYLVSNGISTERLSIAGYAHMRPLVPNSTAAERTRNRRVEFVFVTPKDEKLNVKKLAEGVQRDDHKRQKKPSADGDEDDSAGEGAVIVEPKKDDGAAPSADSASSEKRPKPSPSK